jgi:hypothetical protein
MMPLLFSKENLRKDGTHTYDHDFPVHAFNVKIDPLNPTLKCNGNFLEYCHLECVNHNDLFIVRVTNDDNSGHLCITCIETLQRRLLNACTVAVDR